MHHVIAVDIWCAGAGDGGVGDPVRPVIVLAGDCVGGGGSAEQPHQHHHQASYTPLTLPV